MKPYEALSTSIAEGLCWKLVADLCGSVRCWKILKGYPW
jgi:hypothetical protein